MAAPFDPPLREDGSMFDAGVPAHGYQPNRGKRSEIQDPESGMIHGKTHVSARSPDFFHCTENDNKVFFHQFDEDQDFQSFVRNDPRNARPRAAGLHTSEEEKHDDCIGGCSKKSGMGGPDGRVCDTAVSQESPTWFKTCFEGNREYFAAKGIKHEACTLDAHAHAETGEIKTKIKASRRYDSVCVSSHSPEWMKGPIETCRQKLEEQGHNLRMVHPAMRAARRDANGYGYGHKPSANEDWHRGFGDMPLKKKKERGDACVSSCPVMGVSESSPRWMKSPILSNKGYFEKDGAKVVKDSYAAAEYKPYKRLHTRDPDTGELAHRSLAISLDAIPEWMSSSSPRKVQSPPEKVSSSPRKGAVSLRKELSEKGSQPGGSANLDRVPDRRGQQRSSGKERQTRTEKAPDRMRGDEAGRVRPQGREAPRQR